MNRYELIYIIDTVLEETTRKELVEKYTELLKQNGGEIEKVDDWGKRRLAYAINDMWEGWYVLVTFKSEGELPKEIERNLENNDKILRYLIIKLEEKKQSVKPRPVRVAPIAAPEAPEAEKPVAEEPVAVETPETPAE
ncbi:MAG: 30S ribosomal protein S6 [Candidatus Limiplasma sp.]|nr:30S ribosomal protein S6 [Candidatus Limiplasma sp.]